VRTLWATLHQLLSLPLPLLPLHVVL
jgi:hypothetical protein